MRVAFIHNEKKLHTGANQINDLMSKALSKDGIAVRHFYPHVQLTDTPAHLKGIANILYFYSLLEYKDKILEYDIIQGTTYTPLPFIPFNVPTVCHFGSTSRGFLDSTPATADLPAAQKAVFKAFARDGIIPEFDFNTLRPIQDVADIEEVAALRASACIATSEKVKEELMHAGVPEENIYVIHNAIEDYWFEKQRVMPIKEPHLVYLGRLGSDVFTLKLKGLSRLVGIYRAFPGMSKTTICMTANRRLKEWLKVAFPKHHMFVNLRKDFIPGALASLRGSILILPSRYEGFSLSLIEGMSQGLVPIAFPVGVAPEIIRDGENGFLVSSEKEAIVRIRELVANPEKRLRMAEAARETSQQFQSARIAKELMDVYAQIRAKRRKKAAENR
jgi:glycosyltransferase involved in cell wall biosynthesis